jgi:Icc-related predicted phosphoesterase
VRILSKLLDQNRSTPRAAAEDYVVFFASDVHGSDRCWNKFINAAKFYRASALVMGGDLAGKAVVPIVRIGGGNYEVEFLGQKSKVAATELDATKRRIGFNGFYPFVCDPDEVAELRASQTRLDEVFRRLITEQLVRWMEIAEERLRGTNVACFVMPGNDDEFFIDPILAGASGVINPDLQIVPMGPYQLLSCSWVPPTPWESPRECSEADLAIKLNSLVSRLDPGRPVIASLHSPPYRSSLDDAPEIRPDGSVARSAGLGSVIPVGSVAVRSFIEQVQPLLALHGHIHESRGSVKIGRTVCVNPGSSYGEGVLDGCLVSLRELAVRSTQLVRA